MRTGSSLNRLWAATASALFVLGSAAAPAAAAEAGPGLAPVEQAPDPTADPTPTSDPDPVEPTRPDAPTDGLPVQDPDPVEPTAPAEDPLQPEEPTEPAPVNPTDEPTDAPDRADPAHPDEPVEEAPVLVVVPAITATVIDGAAGYVLPDLAGVTWLLDGTPVTELVAAGAAHHRPDEPAGRFEVTTVSLGRPIEAAVLAAVASAGHLLVTEDGGTATVRYVLDPRVPTELAAPSAADDDGREADAVVVPDAPGQVVRDAAGAALEPGSHPVTSEYVDGAATVELTVEAAAGHRLEVGGAPVEVVPGAGGVWPAALAFTDLTTPVDDEPAPTADLGTDAEPAPDGEGGTGLIPGPHVVTVDRAPEPEPPASAPEAAPTTESAPAAEQPTERLSDSGPQGVDLMVVLSLVFVGGAWLVFGVGREMR